MLPQFLDTLYTLDDASLSKIETENMPAVSPHPNGKPRSHRSFTLVNEHFKKMIFHHLYSSRMLLEGD